MANGGVSERWARGYVQQDPKSPRLQPGRPQPELLLEVSSFEVSLPCYVQQDLESPRSQQGRELMRWCPLVQRTPSR